MPLTKAEARQIVLSLPGAEEKPYFNKPSVFFEGCFVGRVHDKEDAVALTVGSIEMRDAMLEAEPDLFYITDHYRSWPMILARLDALDRKTLGDLFKGRMAQIAAAPEKKKKIRKKKRR